MSRIIRAGTSFDECFWKAGGGDASIALGAGYAVSLSGSGNPGIEDADDGGTTVCSRIAIHIPIGADMTFATSYMGTPTGIGDFYGWHAWMRMTSLVGASPSTCSFLASVPGVYTGGLSGLSDGAVRIKWNTHSRPQGGDPAGWVSAQLQIYDGDVAEDWEDLGNPGDGIDTNSPWSKFELWALEEDLDNAIPRARIRRYAPTGGGSAYEWTTYKDWEEDARIDDHFTQSSLGALGGIQLNGDGGVTYDMASYYTSRATALADLPSGNGDDETDQIHMSSRAAEADVAGGDWSPVGAPANCSTDKHRCVNDWETLDPQPGNEYISVVADKGVAYDEYFDFPALNAGATVEAVFLCAVMDVPSGSSASYISRFLVDDNDGNTDTVPPVTGPGDAGETNRAGGWEHQPDGDPWTKEVFDACSFGVRHYTTRGDPTETSYVHGLIVAVAGAGFSVDAGTSSTWRQAKIAACPAAAARRRSLRVL